MRSARSAAAASHDRARAVLGHHLGVRDLLAGLALLQRRAQLGDIELAAAVRVDLVEDLLELLLVLDVHPEDVLLCGTRKRGGGREGICIQGKRSRGRKRGRRGGYVAAFRNVCLGSRLQCHPPTATIVWPQSSMAILRSGGDGGTPRRRGGFQCGASRTAR